MIEDESGLLAVLHHFSIRGGSGGTFRQVSRDGSSISSTVCPRAQSMESTWT